MRELAGVYPISHLMVWTPRFPRKTKRQGRIMHREPVSKSRLSPQTPPPPLGVR